MTSASRFLILAIALFFAVKRRWREITPILTLALTVCLGLKHLRHQVFVYILVAAYIPVLVTGSLEEMQADPKISALKGRLGWRWPVAAALLIILINGYGVAAKEPFSLIIIPRPELKEQHMTYYPARALKFINQNHLSGNLLTDFNWGEYLIWTFHPRLRVSLDGRFETVYPPVVCREYFDFIYAGPGWRRILEKYPPRMILVDSRAKIYTLLLGDPSFMEVYRDQGSGLFLRQGRVLQPPHNNTGSSRGRP